MLAHLKTAQMRTDALLQVAHPREVQNEQWHNMCGGMGNSATPRCRSRWPVCAPSRRDAAWNAGADRPALWL